MTATVEEPDTVVEASSAVSAALRSDDLAAVSARLLQQSPRAISPMQVQGFLSTVQAHPSLEAADDYARRKTEQATRLGQRVEQQFWDGVHAALEELGTSPEARRAAALVRRFAQHLAADNALRLARQEDAAISGPRRAGPASGSRSPRPEGQQ